MELPRVLVGVITAAPYEYCLDDFLNATKSFVYNNYEILFVDNSKDNTYFEKLKIKGINVVKDEFIENPKERLAHSRNILREYALKNNFDYVLSLEQDVIAPRHTLTTLASNGKDIVGGVYFKLIDFGIESEGKLIKKAKTLIPVAFKFVKNDFNKMMYMSPKEVSGNRIMHVRATGLGCLLISRRVLEKIKFRVDPKEGDSFDDLFFCTDSYKAGFFVHLDTRVKCKHLFLKKDKDVFKN